ncbi:MAG TPA: methyltransferase domain-containing protein [Lutibacter sp.]
MKTKIKSYLNRAEFAHAMIDKYHGQTPNHFISDIGAGYGHMQQKIEAVGGSWQPFDYVKKMNFSIIWDLNNAAPENMAKAGMVVFLEVLEHLGNPLLGIQNIANHMEKGGILILTTPNPQSSKNRLNLLLKGTLYAFQEKHLVEHHVFTPWEHIVRYFLESAGFEILEYAIVDTAYQNRKLTSFKDAVKFYLEKLIELKNDKAKGMSYGIVAIKK